MEPAIKDTQVEAQNAQAGGEHRPFRAWALQQDLNSLLGADPSWKIDPGELGVEAEPRDDAGSLLGQSYLSRKLKPGAGFEARKTTSVVLWLAAFTITAANQWGPLGFKMDGSDFVITLAGIFIAFSLSALAFPLLNQRSYPYVEQFLLIWAAALVGFQCSVTGGADSPYAVWLVFTTFYAAYFMPNRLVAFNTGLAALVALAPLVYASSDATGYTVLYATLLAGVICMTALTVLFSRQLARRAKQGVKFLALADRLTGVANLRAFEQFTTELSEEQGSNFAIAMIDMNGLKGANTVFGYATGDGMIIRLARLMLQVSPASAQVARIGGDEFAVVLPDSGASEIVAWREKFDAAVQEHNDGVRGRLPQISVAIGTAAAPEDGSDSATLLDTADQRMYAQKSPAVAPPYELSSTTSASAQATRVLSDDAVSERKKRPFGPSEYAFQAGSLWLILALGSFAWLLIPHVPVKYPASTAIFCAFSFVIAAFTFASRSPRMRRIGWRVSDISTLIVILPGLWITGGWESPFQLTLIIVIAYYAQFFRGTEAVLRIGGVITLYSIAFWGTGPVSHAGQALFATVVTAEIVIAVILQIDARATDSSLRVIRDSATHDALTGAHNLYAFRTDLGALIARSDRRDDSLSDLPALIIADLDEFRKVNTKAGHRGGDAILRESIRRLETAAAPSGSKVYRIGGDEFAVLFTVDRFSEAAGLAERCKRALAFRPPAHLEIDGQIAASVGFSVLREEMSLEELVIAVETALAEGKAHRGDAFSNDTNVML